MVGNTTTSAKRRATLRKERYRNVRSLSPGFRALMIVVNALRSLLLAMKIDSRVVTASWFVCALFAHTVTGFGYAWSFAAGGLLLYLKIALDIVDGEVGRCEKARMTESEDAVAHMKGIFLDRVQHAIESPLWGVALGIGSYRYTENPWMLVCGGLVAAFRSFARFEPLIIEHLRNEFAHRLTDVHKWSGESRTKERREGILVGFLQRVYETMRFWCQNGKRFNLLVIVCGMAAWILPNQPMGVRIVQYLMYFAGTLGIISVFHSIVATQFGFSLVAELSRFERDVAGRQGANRFERQIPHSADSMQYGDGS